jgi:pyridoxal phosphate enzyme (YggS family)
MEATGVAMDESLARVRERIERAARASGRNADEITLLAVSKGHGSDAIRSAYRLGLRDFGESYVQEWQKKRDELADLADLRWHFVGHLQSNKARFLCQGVSCLQSLDRVSLLEVLERTRIREMGDAPKLSVLVEIQVDETDSGKTGAPVERVREICLALKSCETLRLGGFMGMGPLGKTDEELRILFEQFVRKSRAFWSECSPTPDAAPVLSLGMSDDLEVAIAAGSTLVRVGTALFGARPGHDQGPG